MNVKGTSNKKVKLIGKFLIYIVFIMILVLFAIKGFAFGMDLFSAQGVEASPGRNIVITIPEGANTSKVEDILIKNGLIDNKSTFSMQCKIYEAVFYAGDYTLNTSQSAEEIIEQLKTEPGTAESSDAQED